MGFILFRFNICGSETDHRVKTGIARDIGISTKSCRILFSFVAITVFRKAEIRRVFGMGMILY